MKQKIQTNKPISKNSVDSNFTFSSDYVCFIASIDYCVDLSLIHKTFCENDSHLILKWFQPTSNSFGEVCFLEESYEDMQKNQILQILRAPSIWHQGVCL